MMTLLRMGIIISKEELNAIKLHNLIKCTEEVDIKKLSELVINHNSHKVNKTQICATIHRLCNCGICVPHDGSRNRYLWYDRPQLMLRTTLVCNAVLRGGALEDLTKLFISELIDTLSFTEDMHNAQRILHSAVVRLNEVYSALCRGKISPNSVSAIESLAYDGKRLIFRREQPEYGGEDILNALYRAVTGGEISATDELILRKITKGKNYGY